MHHIPYKVIVYLSHIAISLSVFIYHTERQRHLWLENIDLQIAFHYFQEQVLDMRGYDNARRK
jgi:hypothetical protein